MALVPRVLAELDRFGRGDILVIVGGIVPDKDKTSLINAGVADVFGPGTVVAEAAGRILDRFMPD
jgi:methylmalonyl-CoA mutase